MKTDKGGCLKVFLELGRLVGFEPTTSRTTIWRYYRLSYSRRDKVILTFGSYMRLMGSTSMTSAVAFHLCCSAAVRSAWRTLRSLGRLAAFNRI